MSQKLESKLESKNGIKSWNRRNYLTIVLAITRDLMLNLIGERFTRFQLLFIRFLCYLFYVRISQIKMAKVHWKLEKQWKLYMIYTVDLKFADLSEVDLLHVTCIAMSGRN